jgi:hypothetical protein
MTDGTADIETVNDRNVWKGLLEAAKSLNVPQCKKNNYK